MGIKDEKCTIYCYKNQSEQLRVRVCAGNGNQYDENDESLLTDVWVCFNTIQF